jgi:hypothetical protein
VVRRQAEGKGKGKDDAIAAILTQVILLPAAAA